MREGVIFQIMSSHVFQTSRLSFQLPVPSKCTHIHEKLVDTFTGDCWALSVKSEPVVPLPTIPIAAIPTHYGKILLDAELKIKGGLVKPILQAASVNQGNHYFFFIGLDESKIYRIICVTFASKGKSGLFLHTLRLSILASATKDDAVLEKLVDGLSNIRVL